MCGWYRRQVISKEDFYLKRRDNDSCELARLERWNLRSHHACQWGVHSALGGSRHKLQFVVSQRIVRVAGGVKLGTYQMKAIDLIIPIGAASLTISRVYDSQR